MKSMKALAAVLLTAVALLGAESAMATSYLDASVSTELTQIKTDFGTLATAVWPVVILVALTIVAIRLFKRASSKV